MPLEEWYGDDFARDLGAASEVGLDAAAQSLVNVVAGKLSRRGASASLIRQGRKELKNMELKGYATLRRGRLSDRRRKAIGAALEERRVGEVDPPGGYPRQRAGVLLKSAGYERSEGRRTLGYAVGPASVYGPVHEFGAVIKPKSAPWLVFQLLTGGWVKVKQVTIPARPVWRPSFRESREAMFEAFTSAAASAMSTDAGGEATGG